MYSLHPATLRTTTSSGFYLSSVYSSPATGARGTQFIRHGVQFIQYPGGARRPSLPLPPVPAGPSLLAQRRTLPKSKQRAKRSGAARCNGEGATDGSHARLLRGRVRRTRPLKAILVVLGL